MVELQSQMTDAVQIVLVDMERIDAAVAILFKDRMRNEADPAVGRIVLDLGKVEFIDSSGLGAIVAAMKQLGPGQKLDLAALTPGVEKVFRLTRMDTVFGIYPSVEDALEAGHV